MGIIHLSTGLGTQSSVLVGHQPSAPIRVPHCANGHSEELLKQKSYEIPHAQFISDFTEVTVELRVVLQI